MRSLLSVLTPCLLLALPAAADDAALRKCREIKESTARLACYDALPLGEMRPTPSPSTAPARSPTPAAAAPPPGARPPAAASPQPAPPPAAAGPDSTFGLESRAPVGELPSIESHIPGIFLGWSQHTTIRLANGQVWQVVDEGSRRMRLEDPKVRVRRGMMGAFYLEFEAHNYAPRVRRLQ